jgi:hypothetical protein
MRGAFEWALVAPDYDYFETERRNIRSIFSFVASQQLWLAWAAARAWFAVLCAPLAAWLADWAALLAELAAD